MKKLVKKDANGSLVEVDVKAMRREAATLLRYVDEAPETERAQFGYDDWLRPLINAALDGTVEIPYMHEPYSVHLMMEGILPMLPGKFQSLYFRFLRRIQGAVSLSSCSTIEGGNYVPGASEEVIDGERYEWVIFED